MFLEWLNQRTGYRDLLAPFTRRVLPGGPRWGYATAACVLWMLAVEIVTGLLLMTVYSPSMTTAWASVHYIEQLPGGAFLRGLHYFAGHTLIVLFAIHTIRVLLNASFRAPRELVWITGLLLMPLGVGLAITGNPLSDTMVGYSQIEVEGNIIGSTPVVGPITRTILLGGDEVGHLTLTHLHFLHVALLPLLMGVLLAIHMHQIYRHGLSTDTASNTNSRPYFPYQTVRNMLAFSVVFGAVAFLAWKYGAPLDAPADPELHHIPRPEWYFLFLFELRAYFVGQWEFIATIVIPAACLFLLLAIPAIDRMTPPWLSATIRYVLVISGVAVWTALTLTSVSRDLNDEHYQASQQELHDWASRARALADAQGIPPEGAIALLRNDPKTQGPALFAQHCSSCHSHVDKKGQGVVNEKATAPNLYGFATRKWIAGALDPDQVASKHYFGYPESPFVEGDMVTWVNDTVRDAEDDDKAQIAKDLPKVIAALSAEAKLKSQETLDGEQADLIAEGTTAMVEGLACTDCHKFHDEGDLGSAPDLTGYGSRGWLMAMIRNPEHERFYPDTNDRMPGFAVHPDEPEKNTLTAAQIALLADWLRGEWYEPGQ